MATLANSKGIKIINDNKKAYFNFFIEQKYETGIELKGYEVKSIRSSGISLKESYCIIKKGEVFLVGAHISEYKYEDSIQDPKRDRKLLLHKQEIQKLIGKVTEKGYTLVPTKAYFKNGLVKLEIGLAKGKELHDKRRAIKEREDKRYIERVIKNTL